MLLTSAFTAGVKRDLRLVRDTQEAETAQFSPTGTTVLQSAAVDEQVGRFTVRGEKRYCRAGQWYLRDITMVQCTLDLGPPDPRSVQSNTGH